MEAFISVTHLGCSPHLRTLNAVDLAPLLSIVLDHGGANWASLPFDTLITLILHGDL